ncbi:hypothetical protein INR49_004453 [Caranx melampygus]|nr:hypothetical protein INR49_004453 [Caranx melampygus]
MDARVETAWQTCWSIAKASRERCHSRERRRKSEEQGGEEKAMPGVERLGRASSPLSVWLKAAAPEEIKKCPGMVVVPVDGDELCLASEKRPERKKYLWRTKVHIGAIGPDRGSEARAYRDRGVSRADLRFEWQQRGEPSGRGQTFGFQRVHQSPEEGRACATVEVHDKFLESVVDSQRSWFYPAESQETVCEAKEKHQIPTRSDAVALD